MSIEAITAVLHHSESEGTAKLVMWGIANHHSDSGAWPAISTLAKYAKVSERRVQQIIRELEDMGEIQIDEQGGMGEGQYKTNRYWILVRCPADCDGSLHHKTGVKSGASGVKSGAVRGEIQSHSGVKPVSPESKSNLNRIIEGKTPHLIPNDFEPRAQDWQVMAEHFPWVDLKKQTHAFKDYWSSQPPAKAKKVDWHATWRNWIRRAADYNKPAQTETRTKHKFKLED